VLQKRLTTTKPHAQYPALWVFCAKSSRAPQSSNIITQSLIFSAKSVINPKIDIVCDIIILEAQTITGMNLAETLVAVSAQAADKLLKRI